MDDSNATSARGDRAEPFCHRDYPCPPEGLVSLEPCLAEMSTSIPLFLSQPRFFKARSDVREAFDGIQDANDEEHSSTFHVEPVIH